MIFDGFSPVEGSPLYRQIIRHIQRGLAAGTIRYGDELLVKLAKAVGKESG